MSLNLTGKGLTRIPDYVFKMKNLRKLNLQHNQLRGNFLERIGELKNLEVLYLQAPWKALSF